MGLGFAACSGKDDMTDWNSLSGKAPLVIAHRGASGVLPEHTLAAYERAIDMGADFIEPDLVITKDGYLVARHDRYLSGSTNVSDRPEFADRKVEKAGHDGADWFVEDFTLAEIKSLKARQPRAGRSTAYDYLYDIPTFDEVLNLIQTRSKESGRKIGVYPETKHPKALGDLGLSHDAPLLASLKKYGFAGETDPVFIQSFELENLRRLDSLTSIRLIFLTDKDPDFDLIAKTVDGVGPHKKLLIDGDGNPTGFIQAAHRVGLEVHPWTFRDDDKNPAFEDIDAELKAYYGLGVDGVFSDFPDTARNVRDSFKDVK